MSALDEPRADEPSHRIRGLIAAIGCIAVVGAAFGLSIPLLALLLDDAGASKTMIGLNVALPGLAAILVAPALPGLIRRVGLLLFLRLCLAVMLVSFVSFKLVEDNIVLWFPLRFIMGAAAAGLFVGSETWINLLARDSERGRLLGLYATALAAGFALGPVTLNFTGVHGWPPFIAGAAIFVLAAGPLFVAPAGRGATFARGAAPFKALIAMAPGTFFAAAAFGATETAILNLLPVYMTDLGYAVAAAALVVTVYGVGSITLQFPIGALSDRLGARALLLGCAGVGVVGALLLPLASASLWTLYPLLFVWGGVVVGLYTVGLAQIGASFRGPNLPAANAVFVMMYSVGGFVGPPFAGLITDGMPPHGGAFALAAILALYIGLLVWRRRAEIP